MGRKRVYEVVKHMSAEKLDKRIKKEKDTRVLKRLYFIRKQQAMHGLKDAKGYEGLKPNHGGGNLLNLQKSKRKS